MKDKITGFLKLFLLVLLFFIIVTIWIPFMVVVRLWKAAANDINEFFTPGSKRANIVPLKNSRWH